MVWLMVLLGCATAAVPTIHLAAPGLDEPSGLVESRTRPGVFWSHNDSGGAPELFALDATGRLVGRVQVEGARAVDWEDIAIDDAGNLYVGDIGDNKNVRTDQVIYVVPEPAEGATTVQVSRSIRFTWPDRPAPGAEPRNYDAESLFWAQGSLYLLSKHRSDLATVLYRVPEPAGDVPVALVRLSRFELGGDPKQFGGKATAADATPDGRLLAVLSYHALFLFERPEGSDDYLSRPLRRIDLDQGVVAQCESVAWDGEALLVGNEDGMIFRIEDPIGGPARWP